MLPTDAADGAGWEFPVGVVANVAPDDVELAPSSTVYLRTYMRDKPAIRVACNVH